MTVFLVFSFIVVAVLVFRVVTRTNSGLRAIFAAYGRGACVLKMRPSLIISGRPAKLFLMLFAVTFFCIFTVSIPRIG